MVAQHRQPAHTIVPLLHLFVQSLPPPPGLDEAQLATWQAEGGFLQQLLDNSAAEDYQLPIVINGTLRRYQQVRRKRAAALQRSTAGQLTKRFIQLGSRMARAL